MALFQLHHGLEQTVFRGGVDNENVKSTVVIVDPRCNLQISTEVSLIADKNGGSFEPFLKTRSRNIQMMGIVRTE